MGADSDGWSIVPSRPHSPPLPSSSRACDANSSFSIRNRFSALEPSNEEGAVLSSGVDNYNLETEPCETANTQGDSSKSSQRREPSKGGSVKASSSSCSSSSSSSSSSGSSKKGPSSFSSSSTSSVDRFAGDVLSDPKDLDLSDPARIKNLFSTSNQKTSPSLNSSLTKGVLDVILLNSEASDREGSLPKNFIKAVSWNTQGGLGSGAKQTPSSVSRKKTIPE